MTESSSFQIRFSANYETTLPELICSRYRGNSAGAQEFIELIQSFIKLLSITPRQKPPLGHLEPWPNKSHKPGWEFWKLNFFMPHLKGSAKQGRLMYLLNAEQKEVIFIWIYTHAEYEKRPPDKVLKRVLQSSL